MQASVRGLCEEYAADVFGNCSGGNCGVRSDTGDHPACRAATQILIYVCRNKYNLGGLQYEQTTGRLGKLDFD